MHEPTQQPIPNERLEDLVALADMANEPIPVITNNLFTGGQKASQIRSREAYRRLAYELAGDLAQEVLDLRAQLLNQQHVPDLGGSEISNPQSPEA